MLYEGGVYVFEEATNEDDPNHEIDFGEVNVVGESYYPETYARILGKLGRGEQTTIEVVAVLLREPRNPHDPNAIGVHLVDSRGTGYPAGHLSRDDAEEYVETIKKLERRMKAKVGCMARVYGRGKTGLFDKPMHGCSLLIPDSEEWLGWKKPRD